MNILLMLAHSIAEYDDVRMLTDLGYDVFSIGAYTDPRNPGDDKRPALPNAPSHPELAALVTDQMKAKEHLPEGVIEWADVIIVHHYLDQWVASQWGRIKHKRVIWRTCGQSDDRLEGEMAKLRREGLQIVRYSPAERRYFELNGTFAGVDKLIRFGKYPDDFPLWNGAGKYVANVTQKMAERGEHVGLAFWMQSTRGLPARPAGPGSEVLPGGVGSLSPSALLDYLASAGAYLYTGTVPASYTLGLIEALMVGVPTVSVSSNAWRGPAPLFEADEIVELSTSLPQVAAQQIKDILERPLAARFYSQKARARARELFDVGVVGQQWREFLGPPTVHEAPERALSGAHA